MITSDMARRLPAEMPGLLRVARMLSGDVTRAEDLAQETAARALEKAGTFREEASLTTWLRRILHNLVVDTYRHNRETPSDDLGDQVEALWQDDSYTVDAAVVVARAEARDEMQDALIRLPVAYRTAVVLHDAFGCTVPEVAAIQDVSLAAAKQRLRRARMMLVRELDRGPARREATRGVPMQCWHARSLVSDYLDGDLDPATATQLHSHLESCPTCPPLYASLVATRDSLRRHRIAEDLRDPDSVVPPGLLERIRAHTVPPA